MHGSLVEHVVAPLVLGWQPELVLVSAGFDAHAADPLASLHAERGRASPAMTASMRRACAAVGAPIGLVLEGGYSVSRAGRLDGGGRAGARRPTRCRTRAEPAVHPLARDAAARLAAYWPDQFGSMRRM